MISRKLTAVEGGDRVDSDHCANTGQASAADKACTTTGFASIGTLQTGEGYLRPGRLRAFAPLLLKLSRSFRHLLLGRIGKALRA
jgi:hypothetical protein